VVCIGRAERASPTHLRRGRWCRQDRTVQYKEPDASLDHQERAPLDVVSDPVETGIASFTHSHSHLRMVSYLTSQEARATVPSRTCVSELHNMNSSSAVLTQQPPMLTRDGRNHDWPPIIHPSSIIHHPSSIIHHPSSIIHHPSSIHQLCIEGSTVCTDKNRSQPLPSPLPGRLFQSLAGGSLAGWDGFG
jgi:hypothetical protein